MKVLIISKALVRAAYHTKLKEMAEECELTLVVPERWGDSALEKREASSYRILPRSTRLSGHNHFHWYPGLARLISSERPDIIHIDEEPYSLVTLQAMRATQKMRRPGLFFSWQNIYKRYPFPFSTVERYNLIHASGAIAGNGEAAAVLRRKGFSGPIWTIPQFGVDPSFFSRKDVGDLRRTFGLEGNFVIGFVGRLVSEKGLWVLFDAVARIVGGDWKLMLVGNGPLRPPLARFAQTKGFERKLVWKDAVPSEEVPHYLNCMDVLVLPSISQPNWKEQFGRVLIEAMACEIPVVGSSSGEIPGVVSDAGLIFSEGNAVELATVLELLMRNADRRRDLGAKGRARVLQHFTNRKIATETIAAYREILGL